MESIDRIIAQRVHWQKAKGELLCILEYYHKFEEKVYYDKMTKIINDIIEKIELDSPIA